MTGVCRWVDIRTGTDDMAAVCAGGVAGVALTVADLLLRIEHRGAAAVVTACIDRLKEETAAAGGTHGAELWDRAAPLKGGAVGHQLELGLRLVGTPIFMNRCSAVRHVVFAEILHLPADGLLIGSLFGIKPDLVAGLDDHTGCPTVFHRHKGGVLCPMIGSFVIILVDFCLCVLANATFSLHAAVAACGIGVFDHIPAAPTMWNHDEFLAAGYFAFFGVGIVRFNDELLHRLGRAADVEGILIDTVEAGAVPVPAVIMDMALHRNDIVADGTSEHIDSAAAHCVIASVKHKGMREDALLGAGGHIMRFVIACFEQARELVKSGNYEAIELLYDDIPDTLSQLIRTAFVPKAGMKFVVSDFSAIEARVLSWLAEEKWRLDTFKSGKDIYCASASQMFRVPVEKHGVNGHLRQKGKIAELALGYGGSVCALKAMGALEMGLTEDELQPLVDMWRSSNPNIVRFWWEVDRCVKDTIRQRLRTDTHGIEFEYQCGMLFITLPSGRRLSYVKPRIGENKFGGESVTYEGVGATKKWQRIESYGPKFVENIVQAISRDILCYAMRTLRNYRICGHVHDELVIECPEDTNVAEICEMMDRTPPWTEGLPLRADGYECNFYKKD